MWKHGVGKVCELQDIRTSGWGSAVILQLQVVYTNKYDKIKSEGQNKLEFGIIRWSNA